ncbi:MAG: glycosyltransferase family 4 protein [Anaerolineales bacterium]|nr:glycosyltransferase family 4 protein [Anaerolineales bacterium]
MNHFVLDARTATAHFPGIGRYVTNLVRAMATQLEQGETLTVLHPSNARSAFAPLLGPQVRLQVSDVSPFSLQQQFHLPRLLRQMTTPPTLYHSPYYLMPYNLALPVVLTFYDIIPLRYPDSVSRRARMMFHYTMRMAIRAAAQIVAISDAARNDLLAAFSVAPEKVITTQLAADPRFHPQTEAAKVELRTRYALPPEFVLYLGINKPHKNLVRLIEAYGQLPQSSPPLVIAGAWDSRYPEPKTAAARLDLGDRVRFLGSVEDIDLPALYSAALAFVFPSRYEGFGLPVLEAMACGAPVACSNVSSLPEIAGDAALLFDPEDPAAITAALARLLDAPNLRHDLSTRGLAQSANFTWQRTAAQTLTVYRATSASPRWQ